MKKLLTTTEKKEYRSPKTMIVEFKGENYILNIVTGSNGESGGDLSKERVGQGIDEVIEFYEDNGIW